MKVSKEAKIGISTIIAIFLLIWGFNFLKGKNIFKPTNEFYLVYDELGGLKESSHVLINGFKVGQVTDLYLNPTGNRKVTARIFIDSKYNIPVGSIAKLSSMDFMGTKAIELFLSDQNELHISGDTLQSKIGEGIMDKVAEFEEIAMEITKNLGNVISSLDSILTPLSENSIRSSIANIDTVSGNLAEMLKDDGDIRLIFSKMDSTLAAINNSMKDLPVTMKNLNEISDSLNNANIGLLINQTEQTVESLNDILVKINNGTGTAGMLVNNDSLYIHITNTSRELELLLNDLRNNPKRYVHFSLFGGKDN